MYIETKEIGPDGLVVEKDQAWALPAPEEGADEVQVERVHLSGEVHRESRGHAFSGDISTVARLGCSRCLEPFFLPLDLHFDLLYTSEPDEPHGAESRVDEESFTQVYYDGTRIDLDALLSEQIYLGLPLKPLCRIDCRGLCPRCGANLNQESCGCPAESEADPRLSVLKTLVER
jgi:uncharacterized protein